MKMLEKISSFVQKRPGLILVTVAVITVLFLIPLSHFKIDVSVKPVFPDYINAVGDKWFDIRPKDDFNYLIVESLDKSILSLPAVKEQDRLIRMIEGFLKASHSEDIEIKSFVGLLSKKLERKEKHIAAITSQRKLNRELFEVFAESPDDFKRDFQVFLSAEYNRDTLDRLMKKRKIILNPFLSLFVSKNFDFELPDAKSTPVWFETTSKDLDLRRSLAVSLREMINHIPFMHIRVHHVSYPVVEQDINSRIGGNSIILGILITLVIWLIIFISFRRIFYSAAPIIIMVTAVIWTFGTVSLLGIKFTIIHNIIIPLLMGIGVDGPIHLSKRFLEEIGKPCKRNFAGVIPAEAGIPSRPLDSRFRGNHTDEMTPFNALWITYRETGFSLFLAALTTILAFVSNIVWPGNSSAFRTLGITIIIGISFTLLLTYLLWGAFLSLPIRPNLPFCHPEPHAKDPMGFFPFASLWVKMTNRLSMTLQKIPQKVFDTSMKYSSQIVILLSILTLASLASIPFLKTNATITEVLPKGTQAYADFQFWERQKTAKYRTQAILIEGNVLDPRLVPALDLLKANTRDDSFLEQFEGKIIFESANTLADELKKRLELMINPKFFYDEVLQNTEFADSLLEITWKDKAENLIFKDAQGNYNAIAATVNVDASDSKKIRKAINDLEEDIKRSGLNYIPGIKTSLVGKIFADTKADAYLRENQFRSFGLAIILTFLVLIPIYIPRTRTLSPPAYAKATAGKQGSGSRVKGRVLPSAILCLILLAPIVIASLLTIGLMAIFQVSLTFLSVMVIAITIGLGIDYAIYLSGRYLEELNAHDEKEAARRAIESISGAFWTAAVTTIVGFSILSFSFLPIAKSFGLLSALAIALSVLITLFLLPILLVRFVKK